jgi:tight adherence protein C
VSQFQQAPVPPQGNFVQRSAFGTYDEAPRTGVTVLSLDTALNRVADEIGPSAPELADELAMTAVELNFLPERRQALLNLGRRCDLPAIRGVVNTLVQTEKYGTPLSQSLRVLSGEFREQRMMRAEEKAARLPATLTVPMIVFILPTLFIVLIGPALIDVFDQLSKN